MYQVLDKDTINLEIMLRLVLICDQCLVSLKK